MAATAKAPKDGDAKFYVILHFLQGVMEEGPVLTGDDAFNAHFGESIAAIGDIDDDGYQG